jgi:hypothetical protein
MNKEIHWVLNSLNDRMHYIDAAEKEIEMWRSRYADKSGYTEKEKRLFLALPTQCFEGKEPNQVYKDYVMREV